MKKSFKFIDLFAGIGGFHLALHSLGGECVFASEIDESARETYKRNFEKISPNLFSRGMMNDDIRKVSPNELPDFDVLCAGFPCQPFSQAGYKEGFNDGRNSERGNLFFNIVDILEAKRPKAFFLENVRGIVNHDDGRTFKIIREILEEELKYSFYFKVVKASDYGLPQHRPRAFMIGFRDEGFLKSFYFPPFVPLKFNMSDVFGGHCSRKIGFTLRVGGAGSGIDDRRNWDSYLVGNEVVRIEPEHALKIQGFPNSFKLPKSRAEAMKQLGNSVAIDAVTECAKEMLSHLEILDQRNGENQMVSTKNKGEWSELYSFLKTVYDQKIILGNKNLDAVGANEHLCVSRITTQNIKESILIVDEDEMEVRDENNVVKKRIKIKDHITSYLLSTIREKIVSGSGTFDIAEFSVLKDSLGISITRGGNSNQKADIVLDVNHKGEHFSNQGFGIKSYLGSKPTLLNASGSNTNFVYQVENISEDIAKRINAVSTASKLKDRLSLIYSSGGNLIFKKVEAEAMDYNTRLIDSNMPALLSEMLIEFYRNRTSNLLENLKRIYKNNDRSTIDDQTSSEIKLKRLLVAVLLGLFSGKKWDGKYTSNGTIVVKNNGDQVGFHIVRQSDLEEYLLHHMKFDTPSTTRHRFGSIFSERDGKFYFKLNMQLRFL